MGRELVVPFGDLELFAGARVVAGLVPDPILVWHLGPVSDSQPADRIPGVPAPTPPPPRKVDLIMDLKADQKVTFGLRSRDELGNPTTFDGTIVFAVDDPSIAALTDNGDGTGVVAGVGPLGSTLVRALATRNSDGKTFESSAALNIVAGDAESFTFEFGTPEETTPDEPPAEPTP